MPCRIRARLGPIRSRYLIQWVCILVKYSSLTLKLLLFTCVDIELIIDRAKITSHLPSMVMVIAQQVRELRMNAVFIVRAISNYHSSDGDSHPTIIVKTSDIFGVRHL